MAWKGMNIVSGALLSILPLHIWPVTPDQSASHNLSRSLYAIAQLPAIYALWLSRADGVTA